MIPPKPFPHGAEPSTVANALGVSVEELEDWSPPGDEEAEAALDAALDWEVDWDNEAEAEEALYRGRRPLKAYLMRPSELDKLPPIRWLVEGILPRDALAVLYADPGAGKTFVALDWAGHLSTNRPEWQGYGLAQDTRVLYILAEGAGGLRARRDAWQVHHGATMGDAGLMFLLRAANFMAVSDSYDPGAEASDFDQLKAIVADVRPNLLIVDTMSRAIPGVDENKQSEMSMLFHRADELRELGESMTVLFLHHTNRSSAYRGSSVIHGQVDTMVQIDEGAILRVTKQKDGQEPCIGRIELTPVEGTDSVVPTYHAVILEPDADTVKRATALATLRTGPQHFNALHKAIGGGKDVLRRILFQLVEEGLIEVTEVGQAKLYRLT